MTRMETTQNNTDREINFLSYPRPDISVISVLFLKFCRMQEREFLSLESQLRIWKFEDLKMIHLN